MRARSFLWVGVCYLVALASAFIAARALGPYEGPYGVLIQLAVGDLAATMVVFLWSLAFRNSSFYDPYWSVAPVVIAACCIAVGGAPVARQALLMALISAYGARLTYNWARGWTGLGHEDWRYVDLREKTGPLFQLVNLFGIMLFPTFLVFMGSVPMMPALITGRAPLGVWDLAGCLALGGGTLIQGVADNQLRAFVKTRTDPQEVMQRGLWAWSRHPNYFGEISVWFGVLFFGLGSGALQLWMMAGAGLMVFLFVVISIPMMEKRQAARKPAYREYRARTSMLVPWPPR